MIIGYSWIDLGCLTDLDDKSPNIYSMKEEYRFVT